MRIDHQILVMMTRLFDSEITFDTHSFVSARYKNTHTEYENELQHQIPRNNTIVFLPT